MVSRLLTLPLSNPEGALAFQALTQRWSRHTSTLHMASQALSSVWSRLPSNVEKIDPHRPPPPTHARVTHSIADSQADSHNFVKTNLASTPPDTFVAFCYGASNTNRTGAEALRSDEQSLSLCLRSHDFFTPYDGGLTSLHLTLSLARTVPPNT